MADLLSDVSSAELQRLFDRDAVRAYKVLTRDQGARELPSGRLRRGVIYAKLMLLGVSAKLSPPRRLLFAAALFLTLIGLVKSAQVTLGNGDTASFGAAAVLLLAAVVTLVYLLALELVDRVLVRDELEVARQLQRDLLPASAPSLAGYHFAHTYRTANEVGGDYYNFLELPDGRLALVVGDASGHGMAAGLLMAIAAAVLRLGLEVDPTPERVLSLVNKVLFRTGDRRAFMTVFLALLEPATGELQYVCAGHPFPLLRHADGRIEELGRGGFPLGVRAELDLVSTTTRMGSGDTLLLYSDGLPEAVNHLGEAFGFDRVSSLLRQGGAPQALVRRMHAALDAHLAGEPLLDDLSLVAVEHIIDTAPATPSATPTSQPGARPTDA